MTPFDLLTTQSLWNALSKTFDIERSEFFASSQLDHRVRMDLQNAQQLRERLTRVFQEKVINQLARPPLITARELSALAIQQLAGVPLKYAATLAGPDLQNADLQAWTAKRRFLAFVEGAVREDVESTILFEFGGGFSLGDWRDEGELDGVWEFDNELWRSRSEYFELLGRAKRDFLCYKAEAWLRGDCTDSAMEEAEKELRPVIESIATTIRFSTVNKEEQRLQYLIDDEGGEVLRTCLSTYLEEYESKQKDDVMESLRQAVLCLVKADAQRSSELAFSQCFAAIESLVCFGSEDKNHQISRFVPTLLQPNGLGRTAKGKVLKTLYGWRSCVVHGSPSPISENEKWLVRRIASGVVRAIIRWRAFQERMEKETTQKRLQEDLVHAAGDGKELVQIGIDLSMLLPDSPNQKFDPHVLGTILDEL